MNKYKIVTNKSTYETLPCWCSFGSSTLRDELPAPDPVLLPNWTSWVPNCLCSWELSWLNPCNRGIMTRYEGPMAVNMVTNRGWIEGTPPGVFHVVRNKAMIGTYNKELLSSIYNLGYINLIHISPSLLGCGEGGGRGL